MGECGGGDENRCQMWAFVLKNKTSLKFGTADNSMIETVKWWTVRLRKTRRKLEDWVLQNHPGETQSPESEEEREQKEEDKWRRTDWKIERQIVNTHRVRWQKNTKNIFLQNRNIHRCFHESFSLCYFIFLSLQPIFSLHQRYRSLFIWFFSSHSFILNHVEQEQTWRCPVEPLDLRFEFNNSMFGWRTEGELNVLVQLWGGNVK